MAKLISGIESANALKESLSALVNQCSVAPSICVVQVGSNPASNSYIKQKKKNALEWGFKFEHLTMSSSSTIEEIKYTLIQAQMSNDGVILQLPLDRDQKTTETETAYLLNCIAPNKDADGLHPENLGNLVCSSSTDSNWNSPIPATALGVMRMIDHYKIPITGHNVTVIGKSRLVGMPLAILLMHRGATVSVCHSKTKNLAEYTLKSSLVISAAGVAGLLKPHHFNGSQIVIDVGTTPLEGKLRGDLSDEAKDSVCMYSPVPGGVGPMTVSALMENTLRLHLKKTQIK